MKMEQIDGLCLVDEGESLPLLHRIFVVKHSEEFLACLSGWQILGLYKKYPSEKLIAAFVRRGNTNDGRGIYKRIDVAD